MSTERQWAAAYLAASRTSEWDCPFCGAVTKMTANLFQRAKLITEETGGAYCELSAPAHECPVAA